MYKKVIVVPYDNTWKQEFEKIKNEVLTVLDKHFISIEHVGSTSVEGLDAKPVIDLDIIIENYNSFEYVKEKLAIIGYKHIGDLGIMDRQAFAYEDKPYLLKHHLYVCPAYSVELKKHITFRDHLRKNKEDREWYASVKHLAAKRFPEDIDSYITAKSPCVAEILSRCYKDD